MHPGIHLSPSETFSPRVYVTQMFPVYILQSFSFNLHHVQQTESITNFFLSHCTNHVTVFNDIYQVFSHSLLLHLDHIRNASDVLSKCKQWRRILPQNLLPVSLEGKTVPRWRITLDLFYTDKNQSVLWYFHLTSTFSLSKNIKGDKEKL